MSMPLYESALQGDGEWRSLSLCFFFFLEKELPLALCQNRFGGCFSSGAGGASGNAV